MDTDRPDAPTDARDSADDQPPADAEQPDAEQPDLEPGESATSGDRGTVPGRDAPGPASDPTCRDAREVGRGLFEESMAPSSSMAHLYRGEVHRMTRWRERLDRTTNWAVTVIAAILTWAFTSPTNPHYLVLIGFVALAMFLGIEAHRYRGFDVWRHRVRLIQENVWAHGLDARDDVKDTDWRAELAADYRSPTVKVPFEEAVAHRLRRVYLALGSVVVGAWVVRVTAFADSAGWPASAAVGMIPGTVVTALVALAFASGVFVAFRRRDWHSKSELRARDIGAWDGD